MSDSSLRMRDAWYWFVSLHISTVHTTHFLILEGNFKHLGKLHAVAIINNLSCSLTSSIDWICAVNDAMMLFFKGLQELTLFQRVCWASDPFHYHDLSQCGRYLQHDTKVGEALHYNPQSFNKIIRPGISLPVCDEISLKQKRKLFLKEVKPKPHTRNINIQKIRSYVCPP